MNKWQFLDKLRPHAPDAAPCRAALRRVVLRCDRGQLPAVRGVKILFFYADYVWRMFFYDTWLFWLL